MLLAKRHLVVHAQQPLELQNEPQAVGKSVGVRGACSVDVGIQQVLGVEAEVGPDRLVVPSPASLVHSARRYGGATHVFLIALRRCYCQRGILDLREPCL